MPETKKEKQKQKQTPSYRSIAIMTVVKKWPTGGCYARVPKDWIGHRAAFYLPDKVAVEIVHGLGKDKSHAYVARIPCELAGKEIKIELKDTIK